MSRSVPNLSEEAIERDAAVLLAEFEHARGPVVLQIPIEDIVEKHLRLSLEFDDLQGHFDEPRASEEGADIRGAISGVGRIVIDESLDPDVYPSKESCYRFTVAHEIGHARLHRQQLVRDREQTS